MALLKNLKIINIVLRKEKVDQELVSSFNQEAHKLGLLPQQAESLIKYYNNMTEGSSIQAEEKAAETRLNTENELKREFGPQYAKRLDQAKRLASSTLGNEFFRKYFFTRWIKTWR